MKKLFAILMSVLMIACFMPTMAFADGEGTLAAGEEIKTYVAQVGETQYETLQAAIEAAKEGETITLLNDVNTEVNIDKTITLEGNGKSISGKVNITAPNVVINNVVLNYVGTTDTGSAFTVTTEGNFTLTNSTIEPTVRTALSLKVGGKAVVTGNTINAQEQKIYNGIEFGISEEPSVASGTTVSNNTFQGRFKNNCISFYNLQADAVIEINDNTFGYIGNALRISNPKNVNATFNIARNRYTDTINGEYAGYLICQDYSKDLEIQDFTKITVNFTDLMMGNQLMLSNGTGKNQIYYVYDDQEGIITTNQPKVNFSRSYSGGSYVPTDNVTNQSENTATGTPATTTADINSSTTTAADGTKTTTATVDDQTADKIVDKATANKSEQITIDATSAAGAAAAAEVGIPEKTVKEIAEKTDANLTIKTDAAKVQLDKNAVDALAAQAGTTGTVKLLVKTVKSDADIHQVELKLVTSNGAVTDFHGGNVTVTIKPSATLNAKEVICVYIDDNGVYHRVDGKKNADGTYTFTTGHFSTYAIMSVEDAEKVFEQQDAKAAEQAKEIMLQARSAKTAKGNIKVNLKVNEDAIKAIEDLGYTVKYKFYRSTIKNAKYVGKFETTAKTYTNTTGKKGTRYYYKARVMVYDAQGELVAKTALTQCKYACRIK